MTSRSTLVLAAALATALALPALAADPGAIEVKEKSWDAGTVERGGPVQHVFVYKNVGKGDLTVDAKPGCGCTLVEYDKIVAPGKEGKLTASMNTDNFKGPVTKSVTLTTNDPANARVVLEIKANITVPIDILPMDSISLTAKLGEVKTQELTIKSGDGKAFDVVSVKDVPGLVAKIEPIVEAGAKAPAAKAGTLAAGSSSYKLTVSTKPDAAVGRTFQSLEIATSHPKAPSLKVNVSLLVQGEVEVVPERVYLQGAPPAAAPASGQPAPAVAAPMAQTVKIRKTAGSPLKIDGVSSSDPDFATSLKTITEGREYDLEIKYTGKPGRGMVSGQVTLKTNEPKQPTLTVPVAART